MELPDCCSGQRQDWNEGFLNNLVYGRFLEPIAYEMTKKTLKTLKRNIEAANR